MEWVDIATDQIGFPNGDHGVPAVLLLPMPLVGFRGALRVGDRNQIHRTRVREVRIQFPPGRVCKLSVPRALHSRWPDTSPPALASSRPEARQRASPPANRGSPATARESHPATAARHPTPRPWDRPRSPPASQATATGSASRTPPSAAPKCMTAQRGAPTPEVAEAVAAVKR